MSFWHSEQGGVVSLPLATLFLFLFVFGGMVMHHVNTIKGSVATAAVEGAREYGIHHERDQAKDRTWQALQELGVVKSTDILGAAGCRIFSMDFQDDGTWATCTISGTYFNPFQNLPRLLLSNEKWKPEGFRFKITGSHKHEYEP